MPILNAFTGSGGGVRIPLESVTNLAATPASLKVLISWEDPVDKVATPGGEAVSTWNYTIIVRKVGSAPTTPSDGIEIVRETARNQYKTVPYTDDSYVENGVTYHYAAFAVSTIGVWSTPAVVTATPRSATIEKTERTITIPSAVSSLNGPAYSTSNGTHALFTGFYTWSSNGTSINDSNRLLALDADGTAQTYTSGISGGLDFDYAYNGTPSPFRTPGIFNSYALSFASGSVIKYNQSLTKSTTSWHSSPQTGYMGGFAALSERFIYGGGGVGDGIWRVLGDHSTSLGEQCKGVVSYDTSFTKTVVTDLSGNAAGCSGATAGEYAIIAGGSYWTPMAGDVRGTNASNAYNSSLTKVSVSNLAQARRLMGSASLGGYAFFAGGGSTFNKTLYSTVEVYNPSLTKQSVTGLSKARAQCIPIVFDTAIAFGGGMESFGYNTFTAVDRYDSSLTRTTLDPLVESGGVTHFTGAVAGNAAYYMWSASVSDSINTYIYQ